MGWSRGRDGEDPRKFKLNTSTNIIIMLLHFLENYISFWTPHPIKLNLRKNVSIKIKQNFFDALLLFRDCSSNDMQLYGYNGKRYTFFDKTIYNYSIFDLPHSDWILFYLSHMFILNLECITSGKILYTGNCLQ